jgi:hypothetical protein
MSLKALPKGSTFAREGRGFYFLDCVTSQNLDENQKGSFFKSFGIQSKISGEIAVRETEKDKL